jgi:hypothetical protein
MEGNMKESYSWTIVPVNCRFEEIINQKLNDWQFRKACMVLIGTGCP